MQVFLIENFAFLEMNIPADSQSYRFLASQCIDNNEWYPNNQNINDNFIFAPGYVNFLIIIYTFFDSFFPVLYFNLIINVAIVSLIYLLAKHFYTYKEAVLATYLYLILSSNSFAVIHTYSELPFIFLILLSLYLYTRNSLFLIFVSGVLFILSNWIRPFSILWLLSFLLLAYMLNFNFFKYLSFIFGILITVSCIILFTYSHFQHINYSSTTGGWNLIMGANNNTNGTYNDEVFKKGGIGYISADTCKSNSYYLYGDEKRLRNSEKFNFIQRDSIFKSSAIEWIQANPTKYLSYIPSKIYYLFHTDRHYHVSISSINKQTNSIRKLYKFLFDNKYIRNFQEYFFYFLFLCSIISIFIFWDFKVLILGLPILFSMVVIAITVGAPRYHHVLIPSFIILSSRLINFLTCKLNFFYGKCT